MNLKMWLQIQSVMKINSRLQSRLPKLFSVIKNLIEQEYFGWQKNDFQSKPYQNVP